MLKRKIWYVTHSTGFDYKHELYQPLKESSLWDKHTIILPHDNHDEPKDSRDWIWKADLILAEVSYPSTGQGIELGWASAQGKPIICFHRTGTKPSRSLKYVCKEMFDYGDANELIIKLERLDKFVSGMAGKRIVYIPTAAKGVLEMEKK